LRQVRPRLAMLSLYKVNLEHTINSGQVFLWERDGAAWYGINGQDVLKVEKTVKSYQNARYDLFRDDDDFKRVIRQIGADDIVKNATRRFSGLRLIRQDPFQCYISFIVSANSNIRNIRSSLQKMAQKFGKKVEFDGKKFFLFPTPSKVAGATLSELASCGLGYRAGYVKRAATAVDDGMINLDYLKKVDYSVARDQLCKIDGIGNKVADCIMLFSLEKTEAFPLDRWMIRGLQQYYPSRFSFDGKSITEKKYQLLHDEIVKYFGRYAGYCQQFLFKMIRDEQGGRW
jgi:N-glycosylase/DNA lyase